MRLDGQPAEHMRSFLFALLILSADAALDNSAATLAAATTTVTIGTSPQFWSAMNQNPSSYSVAVGDKLSFKYNNWHNVYLMESAAKYESCDFTEATELASKSHGGGSGSTPNMYEAVVSSAGTLYIACEVSGHCDAGQKVTITAAAASTPSPSPSSPSPPPPSPSSPVSVSTPAGCPIALGEARTVVDFQNVPLSQPTALAWHPTHTSELWVTDAASDSITVLDTSSGATRQLADRAPYHYMARVSSISFDSLGQFATCQESINSYEGTTAGLKSRRPSQTTAPREPPRLLRRLRAGLSNPKPRPSSSDVEEASRKASREGSQNEAWPF